MADEKTTAVNFVRGGYEVQPTGNGGFMVLTLRLETHSFRTSNQMAAFTNSTDFLAWMSAGHAAYDKEIVR